MIGKNMNNLYGHDKNRRSRFSNAKFISLIFLVVYATMVGSSSCLASDIPSLEISSSLKTAVITFSGLYNGIDPWTDFTVVHRPLPQTYQPLMAPSPNTHPVDGGNLGITIKWENAFVSNHGFNGNVKDHTGDNTGQKNELGGAVLFGFPPFFSMTFSKPVEIPSLFWTYYFPNPAKKRGTISVYLNPNDTTPAKTVEINYPDQKAYVWREMKDFAGLAIAKISFQAGDGPIGLNIDDITIHAVTSH
jgi:hypothetical protein